jgi:tripartite-type tricarboxylate transporter receptor subunit TctC
MKPVLRHLSLLGLALALSAIAAAPQASADTYPSRQPRLIIGFPPGSAADITARLVGDHMSRTLGQQIIVEAKPGAGSSLAAEFVARSPADGYTLFIGTSSNVTNAVVSSDLRFDFVKDFAPITPLTGLPLILAVHPTLGVSDLKELIALAKSKPGELTYASVGPGTVPHLSTELLALRTNIKLVHVPYKGSPPAVNDLLGGRVSFMPGVASTIMPHVQAGRLKALASGASKRPHIAPDIPTIAEVAVPGFDNSIWFGLVAPAGTPRPIVDQLNAAAVKALKSDDIASKLMAAGFEPLGSSPEEFAKLIASDMVKWGDAAKAAGMKK